MDVKRALFFLCLPLLVNCSPDQKEDSSGFQKTNVPNCDQQVKKGEFLVRWKDGRITVENANNEKEFITGFLQDHREQIHFAEPHYSINVSQGFSLQQKDLGGYLNWGVDKILAQQAWDQGFRGQGVIVAIIDSGFDPDHEELAGSLAINPNEELNGIDDDENGLIDDYSGYDFANNSAEIKDSTGHGTHIAGIIAANHGVGSIQGTAPDAKLLPLTFIERDGAGSVGAAIEALRYTVERGVKVINASWGGDGCSLALRDEIKSLAKHNILFISAAGNSGNNLDNFPEYPAAFTIDNQIAVGASTVDDKTAGFSNYGLLVSLVAPGANIASTYPLEFDKNEDGLAILSGTSMAAPFVSAAAAILWSKNPEATYLEIKKAILNGVNIGPYPVTTRGQLNIARSLELLAEPAIIDEQP